LLTQAETNLETLLFHHKILLNFELIKIKHKKSYLIDQRASYLVVGSTTVSSGYRIFLLVSAAYRQLSVFYAMGIGSPSFGYTAVETWT
jgi:hypothetical protein